MAYIVETKGLTKKFPGKIAVNNIDMHISKGDIYGFIGKNGAGKTTTMKILLGLLKPTSGTVSLFGSENLDEERRKIGSLIEAPGLYKNCTAFENMKRASLLYGGTDEDIKRLLSFVKLDNVGKRKVGKFSLGMKQRLGIAIAMLGNPELLILDEPINGLDPVAIKEIREVILELNQNHGVTFLISSHLLDELGKITTRYGIVNDGVLVEELSADELKSRCTEGLVIKTSQAQRALEVLSSKYDGVKAECLENELLLSSDIDKSSAIIRLLVEADVEIDEVFRHQNDFEKYFVERIAD